MLFDHFWGLSYHSLPYAEEAKAAQALQPACWNFPHRQSLQTGHQGPGFPNTADTVLGTELVYSASFVLLPLTLGYSCVSQAGPTDGK